MILVDLPAVVLVEQFIGVEAKRALSPNIRQSFRRAAVVPVRKQLMVQHTAVGVEIGIAVPPFVDNRDCQKFGIGIPPFVDNRDCQKFGIGVPPFVDNRDCQNFGIGVPPCVDNRDCQKFGIGVPPFVDNRDCQKFAIRARVASRVPK
jgi:hypothetical protein